MKKIISNLLLLVVVVLTGCASSGGSISVNPSKSDMSIALRTMALTGNQKYFVDVDSDFYDEGALNGSFDKTTPVADTLASVAYFSDYFNGIGSASKMLSNNQAGTLQLASALLDSHQSNIKRLNQTVFAFIPKTQAPTEEAAEKLFFESVKKAVYQMEGDSSRVDVVRYTGHGLNGYRFFTEEDIFVKGKGYIKQGTHEVSGDPMRAKIYIDKIKHASFDPTGARVDCFYIKASLNIVSPSEKNQENKTIEDFVKFSRLMPNWYYQFLMINNVPTVLSSEKLNLFIKPEKESTLKASTPNS